MLNSVQVVYTPISKVIDLNYRFYFEKTLRPIFLTVTLVNNNICPNFPQLFFFFSPHTETTWFTLHGIEVQRFSNNFSNDFRFMEPLLRSEGVHINFIVNTKEMIGPLKYYDFRAQIY